MSALTRRLSLVLCVATWGFLGCGDDDDDTTADAATMPSGGMMATGGMMAAGGMAAGGMAAGGAMDAGVFPDAGEPLLNGCSAAMADDQTGQAEVPLPWGDAHGPVRCTKIAVGTTVVWRVDSSFNNHNLVGGESGEADFDSVITEASPDFDAGTLSVVFEQAGVYPYYCIGHPGDHIGVIYVE